MPLTIKTKTFIAINVSKGIKKSGKLSKNSFLYKRTDNKRK